MDMLNRVTTSLNVVALYTYLVYEGSEISDGEMKLLIACYRHFATTNLSLYYSAMVYWIYQDS